MSILGTLGRFIKISLADKKEPASAKTKPVQVSRGPVVLHLDRFAFTGKSTIGKLYFQDQFECYILEDRDRLSKNKDKRYGETAIPKGTYEIKITYSPKFKRKLPILMNVVGFKGIRIHTGNTAKDTEGCLLPGRTYGVDHVGQSRLAFKALNKKLEKAWGEGKKILIKVGI